MVKAAFVGHCFVDNHGELFQQLTDRWQAGQRVFVEQLLAEQVVTPSLDSEQLLELIFHEIDLRDGCNDGPRLDEYRRRFPGIAEDLETEWAIYRSLGSEDSRTVHSATVGWTLADTNATSPDDSSGRYEIRHELGRGTIGVVFQAWDTQLHRLVAIKRLRTGIDASLDELQRMQAEAQAIAQLHHPNIVQIFDVGRMGGLPYLAVEYCAGGTLADRLKGQLLPNRKAAEFVMQIAQGVAAAHESRIIHRDLKPGNILLTGDDWIPKISDFGLAKLLDNDSGSTASGSILGSPSYMAPEQALGDSKKVGPASDIYAIGAILYECLTGRPPFRGASVVETLDQVCRQEPIAVRDLEPQIPIDLETIVHKCLRKDRAQRYETATALADDLRRYLNREAIHARRERGHERMLRLVRRYPMQASLIAASGFLLLTIVVGSLAFASYLYDARESTKKSEREARLGQAEALVGRAHGIRLSGRAGQRFEALESIRAAAEIGQALEQPREWFEPLRDETISAMLLPDTKVDWFQPEAETVVYGIVNSDQTLVAIALENGQVLVRSLPDYELVVKFPLHQSEQRVEFVGTNRLLMIAIADCSVECWTLNQPHGKLQWSYHWSVTGGGGVQIASSISRDEKTLLISDSRELVALNLDDGKLISRWPAHPFSQHLRLAMHPEQPWVLLHSYMHPFIEIRDWQTGQVLCEVTPDKVDASPGYSGADWSADGKEMLLLSGHGKSLDWYELKAARREMSGKSPKTFEQNQPVRELPQTSRSDNDELRLILKRSLTRISPDRWPQGASLRWDSFNDKIYFRDWGSRFHTHDFRSGQTISRIQGALINPTVDRNGIVLIDSANPKRAGLLTHADGNECRCVSGPSDKSHSEMPMCHYLKFDPTGRFLVTITDEGFVVIDSSCRQVIAKIGRSGWTFGDLAFDKTNHFYIATALGMLRFPYQLNAGSHQLKIGFPERVHLPSCATTIGCSDDGQTLAGGAWNGFASVYYAGAWIKTAAEPAAQWVQTGLSGVECAVSPDGEQVATVVDGVQLFDTRPSCRPRWRNSTFDSANLFFTSSGRELVAGTLCFETETGAKVCTWRHAVRGLSADTQTAVGFTDVGSSEESIALFDWRTGKVQARFQPPTLADAVQLSPDKTRLATISDFRVWICDLPVINSGLKQFGYGMNVDEVISGAVASQPLTEVHFPDALTEDLSLNELFQEIDRRTLEAAEDHPDDGQWQFSAGMAAVESRDLSAAETFLKRSSELLPSAVTPRLWRAFVRAELENFEGAVADANWVLERCDDPRAWLQRSEWNFRLGRFDAAIKDCTVCLDRRFPQSRYSLALRARCHLALGHTADAEADEKSLAEKLVPTLETTLESIRHMVGFDLSFHRPATALADLEQILESPLVRDKELDGELKQQLAYIEGLILYRNGRFEDAVEAVQSNLQAANDMELLSHLICALARARLKQTTAANEHRQLADRISTTNIPSDVLREIDVLRAELKKID